MGYPKTREDEEDALVLLRDDVGLYFALGGSRVLRKAHEDLEVIRLRRQERLKRAYDPIVTNIIRCTGIDTGRIYVRRHQGQFVVDAGNRERAADLLESLDEQALRAFDGDTAAETKRLAQKHRQRAHK